MSHASGTGQNAPLITETEGTTMRFHHSSREPRRRALGITLTALAMTLAACSSASNTTANTTKHHAAAPSAAAPAASQPAPAAAASALPGTWRGQYGGSYQGTFVLHWHQSGPKLDGHIHISNPASTLPIHGQLAGGSIRFGTVGSYRITYTGTVSGASMSGTYQVNGVGQGGNWSASKG
jgi:hypothetical protein